jgi:hypothetical protein
VKAFLSHSSRDKATVEEVAASLGASQVEIDSETFDSGELNVAVIQAALKRCSVFVLFLTASAIDSSYVRFEAKFAQELLAKGLIEKYFVICIDPASFNRVPEEWKVYSFVRHLSSPQSIARFIQHQLVIDRARSAFKEQPYVERRELNDLKERLIQPNSLQPKAIYISGNSGIGRRTLARRLYKDRYPHITSVFPEIQIDSLDGYDEIYRKIAQELMPNWPISNWRARILGFSIADEAGKAAQIAALLDQLTDAREAIFVRDGGGLLDKEGAFQKPLAQIYAKMRPQAHPTVVFIAQRMMPRSLRLDQSIAYCALPAMSNAEARQLAAFLLTDSRISYSDDDLNRIVDLSDGHPFNVKFLTEAAKQYSLPVALGNTGEFTKWKQRRASEFLRGIEFTDDEKTILAVLRDFRSRTHKMIPFSGML